ncbi:hypothetical protein D3C75_619700 [compost metagenome]
MVIGTVIRYVAINGFCHNMALRHDMVVTTRQRHMPLIPLHIILQINAGLFVLTLACFGQQTLVDGGISRVTWVVIVETARAAGLAGPWVDIGGISGIIRQVIGVFMELTAEHHFMIQLASGEICFQLVINGISIKR